MDKDGGVGSTLTEAMITLETCAIVRRCSHGIQHTGVVGPTRRIDYVKRSQSIRILR